MKNVKDKIIISAAVGFTAASGITPVFAQETTNAEVIKEDVEAKKTKKEKLEDSVKNAQENLDSAKATAKESKAGVDEAKDTLDEVTVAQENQQEVVDSAYNMANNAINVDLQPILDEISSLESQINDSKKELEEQTAKNEQASKDLEEAQKSLETKKTELKTLQDKLAGMKSSEDLNADYIKSNEDASKAQEAVNKAQADADIAKANLEAAQNDLTTKENSLNQARTDYENATSDVTTKQSAVTAAQATLDALSDPDGVNKAKADLATAQTELQTAQQNQTNAESALTAANTAYETAKKAKATAESNLTNAQNDLTTAQTKLDEAKTNEQTAKDSLDTAKADQQKNEDEINVLKTKINTAQGEVDKAQKDYDNALKVYNSTLTPLEQAQKNLSDYETAHATELARLSQGSKGYFDSIGVSKIVDPVFDKNNPNTAKAELATHTQMGQKNDATSLENMQASIAYMKECNDLRKKHNLSELKVSMWLMAVAQVNANNARDYFGHAEVYYTAENLAWGWSDAYTDYSPYRGWYDQEKKEYDSGNHKFSETGHYQNIVEKGFTVTGFGVETAGGLSTAYSQEFLDEANTDDTVMTVSEFETSFNNYYNNLKSVEAQHKALQNAVNNAGTGTKDDTALKNAEALLNVKKATLASLRSQKTAKENNVGTLSANVNSAQSAYDAAVSNTKSANQRVEDAKAAKASVETALNGAKDVLKAKETAVQKATSNVAGAKAKTVEAESKVNALKDRINNWTENTEKAKKDLQNAKDALVKAKTRKAQLKGALDNATDAHKKASEAVDAEKATSNSANNKLASAKNELDTKLTLRDAAKDALDAYNSTVDSVNALNEDIVGLENTIKSKETEKAESTESIAGLKLDIEKATNDKAKLEGEAVPFKEAQKVLNNVLSEGSKADTFSITDEELLGYFTVLGKEVDKLHEIDVELNDAKEEYTYKLSLYNEALVNQAKAQASYDDAMKALDKYIEDTAKHVVKQNSETVKKTNVATVSGTNTGVETDLGLDVAMMGVAALGIVEAKRRSKKQ